MSQTPPCPRAIAEANSHLDHAARLLAGVNQAYELGIDSSDPAGAVAEAAIAQAVTATATAYIRLAEVGAALHDCTNCTRPR